MDTDQMLDELHHRKVARHMRRYSPHFTLMSVLIIGAIALALRGLGWWALACLAGAGLVFWYVMSRPVRWRRD